MASRQREWQRKRIADGKCQTCGKPRGLRSSYLCDDCRDKENVRQNERKKNKRLDSANAG